MYPLERAFDEVGRAPLLSREAIHLWLGPINGRSWPSNLKTSLSSEEKDRAHRIESDDLRNRYINSHGLLRAILGRYCNKDPSSLNFWYGCRGKPYLSSKFPHDIRFSVSNTGSFVAYAFVLERNIGVDIEPVRAFRSMNRFVARYFYEHGKKEFQSLKGQTRVRSFFRVWTGMEAYLKGTGDGLARNLREISFVRESDGSSGVYAFSGGLWNPTPWTIYHFEPEDGIVASVALERSTETTRNS